MVPAPKTRAPTQLQRSLLYHSLQLSHTCQQGTGHLSCGHQPGLETRWGLSSTSPALLDTTSPLNQGTVCGSHRPSAPLLDQLWEGRPRLLLGLQSHCRAGCGGTSLLQAVLWSSKQNHLLPPPPSAIHGPSTPPNVRQDILNLGKLHLFLVSREATKPLSHFVLSSSLPVFPCKNWLPTCSLIALPKQGPRPPLRPRLRLSGSGASP